MAGIPDDEAHQEYREKIREASTANKTKMLGNLKVTGRYGANTILNPKGDRRLISEIIDEYKEKGVSLRKDWEQAKDGVMDTAVSAKMAQHSDLRKLLLSTGDKVIRESSPSDLYWGIGRDGKGKNKLGITLMRVRDRLRGVTRDDSYYEKLTKEAAKKFGGTDASKARARGDEDE